jgi:hypothetical protein
MVLAAAAWAQQEVQIDAPPGWFNGDWVDGNYGDGLGWSINAHSVYDFNNGRRFRIVEWLKRTTTYDLLPEYLGIVDETEFVSLWRIDDATMGVTVWDIPPGETAADAKGTNYTLTRKKG